MVEISNGMITIKTKEEIKILREGGRRLAIILEKVIAAAKPGISTYDLDRLAESLIFESGGAPSFKGYKIRETKIPYPGSLCVSVNDEVVHAVPRKDKILQEGDVVGLDIGMRWPTRVTTNYKLSRREVGIQTSLSKYTNGASGQTTNSLFTDMAVTVGIGQISPEAEQLIRATKESLDIGIREVRVGARVGDIGYSIQKHLEKYKFGIIRDLAGHGVGYQVHEEPLIPNYGKPGTGSELKEGMVIAIEPMATLGGWQVELQNDEWTFKTADGSLAAHFEHTVVITKAGVEILTVV